MKCQDFRELIDSYLSDELLTETNHNVLRHMENCAPCRRVIQARREIREHLKTAIINAPQYQIGKNFTHHLQTQLRFAAFEETKSGSDFRFRFKSLAAVVAGLILTFALAFLVYNNLGDGPVTADGEDKYTVPNLPANNLVNVAAGDHEHCAIRHKLDEKPVSLNEASAKYKGLEKTVVKPLESVLSEYKLVAAHACRYKKTQFAHLILKNGENTLSVLVTDADDSENLRETGLLNFSSEDYRIARFNLRKRAVFVISNLDQKANSRAAEALSVPLRKHFAEPEQTLQTALLMFY